MLGSNLSAMTGNGDMGQHTVRFMLPFFHVSVLNALNPRALARNKYPVGPPEAYSIIISYEPPC